MGTKVVPAQLSAWRAYRGRLFISSMLACRVVAESRATELKAPRNETPKASRDVELERCFLPSRLEVRGSVVSSQRGWQQTHLGEFIFEKTLLVAAIFTILLYDRC